MITITKEAKDALKEKIEKLRFIPVDFNSDDDRVVYLCQVEQLIDSVPEMKMPSGLDLINATKFYIQDDGYVIYGSMTENEKNLQDIRNLILADAFNQGANYVINYMKGETK